MTTYVATALIALQMALGTPAEIPLTELTVDGHDYPVCAVEDCSDQPGQVGLWLDSDTGDWWLSTGETSVLVVDDTVTP